MNSNKGNYYWYNMFNGGRHICFLTPEQAEIYSKCCPTLNLTLIPTKKKEENFSKRRKYGRL